MHFAWIILPAPAILNFDVGLVRVNHSSLSLFPLFFSLNASTSPATSGGWSQAAKNVAWESCLWFQTADAQRGTKLLLKKKLILHRSRPAPYFRSISIQRSRGCIRVKRFCDNRESASVLLKLNQHKYTLFLFPSIYFGYIYFYAHLPRQSVYRNINVWKKRGEKRRARCGSRFNDQKFSFPASAERWPSECRFTGTRCRIARLRNPQDKVRAQAGQMRVWNVAAGRARAGSAFGIIPRLAE